nr:hypothetical protein Iba_chr14cCG14590 [Ipomoea batatas]
MLRTVRHHMGCELRGQCYNNIIRYGGDKSHREDFRADSHDRAVNVFQSYDLHAFPGIPRRTRAGRRVPRYRVREYHRILCHRRAGYGDGAHLRPGLRRETDETSRADLTENGRGNRVNGAYFHSFRHS